MSKRRFGKSSEAEYLEHMRAGMRRGAAAEAMNFERAQAIAYLREHPDFEAQVLEAEAEATEHVEEALYQAAVSGNVSACRMWLELRDPRPKTGMALAVVSEPGEPQQTQSAGDLLRDLTTD